MPSLLVIGEQEPTVKLVFPKYLIDIPTPLPYPIYVVPIPPSIEGPKLPNLVNSTTPTGVWYVLPKRPKELLVVWSRISPYYRTSLSDLTLLPSWSSSRSGDWRIRENSNMLHKRLRCLSMEYGWVYIGMLQHYGRIC